MAATNVIVWILVSVVAHQSLANHLIPSNSIEGWEDCAEHTDTASPDQKPWINWIELTGCNQNNKKLCEIEAGAELHIKLGFNAPKPIQTAKLVLETKINGSKQWFPYPVYEDDACKIIPCPITKTTEEITLHRVSTIPEFAPAHCAQARYTIRDETNATVVCFTGHFKITRNNQPPNATVATIETFFPLLKLEADGADPVCV